MAVAAPAVAGRFVGAAVEGLVGGTQGAADGIRDGWRKGGQSVAGRPGRRGLRGSPAEYPDPPREYATGGLHAVSPDDDPVDVRIAPTTNGGLGDQRRCESPKPVSVS
jgi:hypothetical protein